MVCDSDTALSLISEPSFTSREGLFFFLHKCGASCYLQTNMLMTADKWMPQLRAQLSQQHIDFLFFGHVLIKSGSHDNLVLNL